MGFYLKLKSDFYRGRKEYDTKLWYFLCFKVYEMQEKLERTISY